MFLLNPEDTRVILIGASEFEDEKLPPLPAIKDNNVKLRRLLHEVVGISKDNIRILEDRDYSNQITAEISEITAKGLNIIYYAGHGLPHAKQLYLATKKTKFADPKHTGALLADDLLRIIINKNQARRIIFIFDCCFSGFARENIDTKDKEVFLLTATSSLETAKSEAPENDNYTAFTHELLTILEQGIKNAREILTLQDIFSCLKEQLKNKNLPLPQISSHGLLNELGICKNRATETFKREENNSSLYIAITWIIRLLSEDELDWVQIDVMVLPGQQKKQIYINEMVAHYQDGYKRLIIQANKNKTGEIYHHTLNEILERQVPHAQTALPILKYFVENQSKLRGSKRRLTREDIISELDKHHIVRFPQKTETEILNFFKEASQIGRQDISREIAGEKLYRVELKTIIELLDNGEKTILLTDRPGSGKTWLLLELTDVMEEKFQWGILFIKGDRFDHIDSEASLHHEGLPDDIVGSVSRLSTYRKVVVIIDSLDVLSLSRDHRALKVFLSLLDRLEKVPNVSIVAACRHFDLSYDPLLRNRNWSHKISVPALDFESTVSPILKKWNLDPTTVPNEQRKLLSVPQHLKLFERISDKVSLNVLTSSYQLYDIFLEEIVIKDAHLGEQAMAALEKMAVQLVNNRKLSMSKAAFTGNEEIYRRLVSSGVIRQGNDLAFSHQTLLDTMVARNSLKIGESLEEFVLRHPPMPFIRPSVRTFFFYLRIHESQAFSKQVKKVLNHDNIAYHLKRLIVESLAEIQPNSRDLPLFQWLLQNHTDLFHRFLERIKDEVWFDFFSKNLFQKLLTDKDLRTSFVCKLADWMNTKPSEVIPFWLTALKLDKKVGNNISFRLDKFEHWEIVEIEELIESLIQIGYSDESLGKFISQYVEMTGKGDDLLWQYIVADISEEEMKSSHKLEDKLRYDFHTFHNENFFKKRLCDSDELLTLFIELIENCSYQNCLIYDEKISVLRNFCLDRTSWEYRHTKYDLCSVTSLTEIFCAIEEALNIRSKKYDKWWQKNEKNLRKTREAAIAYLLIQAYRRNIEQNVSGIEEFLNRDEVLQYTRLSHELGELIQEAYPSFSHHFQEKLQSKILSYLDKVTKDEWVLKQIYHLLCWVPRFFRSLNVQNFIEIEKQKFGICPQSPEIYGQGGRVRSPISVEQMMSLSDHTLLKLFKYYDQDFHNFHYEFLVDDKSIISTFQECCTLDPARFFLLVERISEENICQDYAIAIMLGIASHLMYRFGNLKPSNGWKPIEPLPEGEVLARLILNWLIKNTDFWWGQAFWKNGRNVADILQACCNILTTQEEVEWLILLLFRLIVHNDPEEREEGDSTFISLNSVRGKAAKSAIVLAINLLKIKQPLPELFLPLLHRFAQDRMIAVRVSILRHLPHLTYYDANIGWPLFNITFKDSQIDLWTDSERFLYYEYDKNFARVKPYLDRIKTEAIHVAGQTWARISTLACFSGHLTESQLFNDLSTLDEKEAWLGATEVFCANIGDSKLSDICERGILLILQKKTIPTKVLKKIGLVFKKLNQYGNNHLAYNFINAFQDEQELHRQHHFFEWIADYSNYDPMSALPLCEKLLDKIEQLEYFWHTKPLVSATLRILQEADETDDTAIINRAITLQDRLLKLNSSGMIEALNELTRNI